MKRFLTLTVVMLFVSTSAFAADTANWEWTKFTNHNDAFSIGPDGDTVWIGSTAGLVKWTVPAEGSDPAFEIVDEFIPVDYYVNSILIRDNVTWFSVEGMGVVKLENGAWTTYSSTNSGLPNDWVWGLDFDPAGNMWVATSSGVARFDGTAWTVFTEEDGLVGEYSTSIAVDGNGNVWVGSWSGLSRYNAGNGTWSVFTSETAGLPADTINDIAIGLDNTAYVTTSNGLAVYNGTWKTYTTDNGLPANDLGEIDIASNGLLWIGTYHIGAFSTDLSSYTLYGTADGLRNTSVSGLEIDSDGTVWFATNKGSSGFDGSRWVTLTETNVPVSNYTNKVFVDSQGGVWVGTDMGVSLYTGGEWRHFDVEDGLSDSYITDIEEDGFGAMWFTTNNGVSKKAGDSFTTYTTENSDIPADYSIVVSFDPATGLLWFAFGEGAASFDGSTWTTYNTDDGMKSSVVNDILATDNYIWFSHWEGLSRLNKSNGTWDTFTAADGLSNTAVGGMVYDAGSGSTWFGTFGGGINKYNGSSWSSITVNDGLGDDNVNVLDINPVLGIVAGSWHTGVSVVDDGAVTVYTSENSGLISNSINSVSSQRDGRIWIATGFGLSSYGPVDAPGYPVAVATHQDTEHPDNSPVVTWETPQQGATVTAYNIYRSRSEAVTGEPVTASSFDTVDDLLAAEATRRILMETVTPNIFSWHDTTAQLMNEPYYYWVAVVADGVVGQLILADPGMLDVDDSNPFAFSLKNAYPNPFNPSTTIEFTIPRSERVSLAIYNMTGQLVRTLVDDIRTTGNHRVVWDGRDDNGAPVASGVYVSTLRAGEQIASGRMLLIK